MSQTKNTRHSFGRRVLAAALALALTCPAGSGLLPAARAQDVPPPVPQAAPAPASDNTTGSAVLIPTVPPPAPPIKTVLLFPFANAIPAGSTSGGFNPDITGARVEDAVKMRLNVIGRIKANSFSPTLPQIQRALQEARIEGLTENDITPPYNDAAKGQKITDQVGTDGYLLGTIEALSVDPATRSVTLTVSATLYSAVTGASVKSLAYTGHGISYNATDDPEALLQSAVNDVAGHVVSALNARPDEQQRPVGYSQHYTSPDSVRGRRSNSGSILLGILLATGLGLAISSGHHSSGGGSSSTTTGTGTGTGSSGPPGVPVVTVPSGGPPSPPNP